MERPDFAVDGNLGYECSDVDDWVENALLYIKALEWSNQRLQNLARFQRDVCDLVEVMMPQQPNPSTLTFTWDGLSVQELRRRMAVLRTHKQVWAALGELVGHVG